MKTGVHPTIKKIKFVCNCGESEGLVCEAFSTIKDEVYKVEVCSYCHPFYTGKQRIVDTGGRVDKFKKKMQKAQEVKASKKKGETKTTEASVAEMKPEVKEEIKEELKAEEPKEEARTEEMKSEKPAKKAKKAKK